MKRFITLLALTASFAFLVPATSQAHDRGRHRGHHHGYHPSAQRQLVMVGYDRWGRPRYEWRTVNRYPARYGHPGYRHYQHPAYRPPFARGPQFRIGVSAFPRW